jgi:hypothetical protein
MNEINKVLDRCIAKSDEHQSQPQTLPDMKKTLTVVTEFGHLIKCCLAYNALRLEMSLLLLEASLLLLALRERAGAEQPKQRIETVADFEAALRGSPKARVSP